MMANNYRIVGVTRITCMCRFHREVPLPDRLCSYLTKENMAHLKKMVGNTPLFLLEPTEDLKVA